MTLFLVQPGGMLTGEINIPGDKSISHRAVMLGAIANGATRISNFLEGEDALATLNIFRDLGVRIEGPKHGEVAIAGVGMHGLKAPSRVLDCGNSGTSMRLLCGILAGQDFDCELTGDESLLRRPMRRVTEPLNLRGARIATFDGGLPPVRISGQTTLKGITYEIPMPSAQVKSALLLAGLYAQGRTCIIEPAPTRDHTEQMLAAFGCAVTRGRNQVSIEGSGELKGNAIHVPADLSSAAFFMVGASLALGSDVTLKEVGINPTRAGVIEILRSMGADILLSNEKTLGSEPVADIRVRHAKLKGIEIPPTLVANAIDDFPVLFIAAANAEGETQLSGAHELRVKESDRIQTMADGMSALGIRATATEDGMRIIGGAYEGGEVDSRGDHRVAMAFSIAGLRAKEAIVVRDCANVATSFPGFVDVARNAGLRISEE
ncbi:MAG: 3-phosphoshikimate 1-carboxyvinyltransferase [Burkholderiales bacterium]